MNRPLGWALGLTLATSALALWPTDAQDPPAHNAHDARGARSSHDTHAQPGPAAARLLPHTLPRPSLSAALSDPFEAEDPPAAPPPEPELLAPAPPPAPPPPPALNARFVGSFVTAAGQRQLFVAVGEREYTLVQGDRLPDDFLLKSLSAETAEFVHEPSGATQSLPLAAAPGATP